MRIRRIVIGAMAMFFLTGCQQPSSQPSTYVSPTQAKTTVTEPVVQKDTATKVAENILNSLKSILKNPASLQVNSIRYCSIHDLKYKFSEENFLDRFAQMGNYYGIRDHVNKSDYFFELDVSAQNGLGGMNRDVYYLTMPANEYSFVDLDYFDTNQSSFADLAVFLQFYENAFNKSIDLDLLEY